MTDSTSTKKPPAPPSTPTPTQTASTVGSGKPSLGLVSPATSGAGSPAGKIEPKVEPQRDTILPEVLRKSLFFISGQLGSGKSGFAASLDIPDNILPIDFESKGELIYRQLGCENYIDAVELVSNRKGSFKWKPREMFQELEVLLTKIPKGRFTVLVLDNIDAFQQAIEAEIKGNALTYGLDPKKAESGSYGENWKGVNSVVGNLVQLAYSRGVRVVVVISHLSHPWIDNKPVPTKWTVKGVQTFARLSCLSLIMMPGSLDRGGDIENPDAPSALVKKESLMHVRYDPQVRRTVIRKRIPYRMPVATPTALFDYLGADETKWFNAKTPRVGELATEEDWKPYRDILTPEEYREIVEAAKVGVEAARIERERMVQESGSGEEG